MCFLCVFVYHLHIPRLTPGVFICVIINNLHVHNRSFHSHHPRCSCRRMLCISWSSLRTCPQIGSCDRAAMSNWRLACSSTWWSRCILRYVSQQLNIHTPVNTGCIYLCSLYLTSCLSQVTAVSGVVLPPALTGIGRPWHLLLVTTSSVYNLCVSTESNSLIWNTRSLRTTTYVVLLVEPYAG